MAIIAFVACLENGRFALMETQLRKSDPVTGDRCQTLRRVKTFGAESR